MNNNVKKVNTYDYLVIVGMFLMFIMVVSVGSYAYVTWRGEDTLGGLTTTIGDLATVTFEKGVNLSSDNLSPVLSYEDGIYSTFNINKKIDDDVLMKVYLTINSIDEELKSQNLKYKLFVSSDNNNFDNVANGDFSSVDLSRLNIIENYKLTSQIIYCRLYIYLDGRMNNSNMMGKSLDLILNIGADLVSDVIVEDDLNNEVLEDDEVDNNITSSVLDDWIDLSGNDVVSE